MLIQKVVQILCSKAVWIIKLWVSADCNVPSSSDFLSKLHIYRILVVTYNIVCILLFTFI